ncbi:MAG: GerMN domain-containing protein [Lachnospiraceae bacterium]|jgi:germination protein M|nr:GerMN domain-containing protein [Lachnospiraceae bacterium]
MKKYMLLIICILSAILLAACAEGESYAHTFLVYHIKNDETGITSREYRTDSEGTEALVAELMEELYRVSEKLEYKSPLVGEFTLLDYSLAEGQITINFNDAYKDLPTITEILTRAAIVRTLTQVEGVRSVAITVRGEALLDRTGNVVGVMSGETFIDNVGTELNAYEKTNLRLYFASADAEGRAGGLTSVYRSGVVYNSNVAPEKLVVESVINGPWEEEEVQATLNPATRILAVTVTDGTCYVNLDEQFALPLPGISGELAVYSLVNSLIELPNVNHVRISINGQSPLAFETVNLNTVFERNLDIIH